MQAHSGKHPGLPETWRLCGQCGKEMKSGPAGRRQIRSVTQRGWRPLRGRIVDACGREAPSRPDLPHLPTRGRKSFADSTTIVNSALPMPPSRSLTVSVTTYALTASFYPGRVVSMHVVFAPLTVHERRGAEVGAGGSA